MDTEWIRNGYRMDTQVSIGQIRVNKEKVYSNEYTKEKVAKRMFRVI